MLLEVKINKFLYLQDYYYNDFYKNIDFLNRKAILNNDLNQKLKLLSDAILQLEKFHSFFHFEQSYYHLLLAIEYIKNNNFTQASEQIKASLFQDPRNLNSKILQNTLNNNEKITNKNFEVTYNRPFQDFISYLSFATNNTNLKDSKSYNIIENKLCWWCKEEILDQAEYLENVVNNIRYSHLNYHSESAKIYVNRSIIFDLLGDKSLSNNDLIKAKNLDNILENKPYITEKIRNEINRI